MKKRTSRRQKGVDEEEDEQEVKGGGRGRKKTMQGRNKEDRENTRMVCDTIRGKRWRRARRN